MRQQPSCNTVSLIPAIDGDVQVVVGSAGLILLDVQGAHRDVFGDVVHDHGVVRLSYSAACALRDLIDQIAEPADPRQTALWSPSFYTTPTRPRRALPRRRAA